ncbi:MAG: M23 family metallopeptidase [Deltaproteobacteria bacterium]
MGSAIRRLALGAVCAALGCAGSRGGATSSGSTSSGTAGGVTGRGTSGGTTGAKGTTSGGGTTGARGTSSSGGGTSGSSTSGSSGASGGTSGGALPICDCYDGAGLYCGSGISQHTQGGTCTVPGLASNQGNLYGCAGAAGSPGTWTVSQSCGAAGCFVAPAGTNDGCNGTQPSCPCYAGDGVYCGSGAQAYASQNRCAIPGLASNAGNLYQCTAGAWSVQTQCPNGCTVAPAGTNDYCNPAPTPCPCYAGDGTYCADGVACYATVHGCTVPNLQASQGNLLACAGGSWSAQTTCGAAGCLIAPNGQNDVCASASAPVCSCYAGDGAYCAAGAEHQAVQSNCRIPAAAGNACNVLACSGGSWSVQTTCPYGCYTAPAGTSDGCNASASSSSFYLPWTSGQTYTCTQGNNGDICGSNNGDHTGIQAYCWDFGLPLDTPVLAARGGTVSVAAQNVGPGQACYGGCTQPFGTSAFWSCCNTCLNQANWVNVNHGDGTVATYWHLDSVAVSVGQHVSAGDVIGHSGTSGCSSGAHLHYCVMGNCPTGYCQSVPSSFVEAGVPACGQSLTSANP